MANYLSVILYSTNMVKIKENYLLNLKEVEQLREALL